jgi:ATP-dependent RNA helicase DDX46/PRP5
MQAAREAEAQRQAREATAAAAAKAAAIAAQLSRGKAGGPGSGSSGSAHGGMSVDGEEKRAFFSEIEINDYPQHARWKVTHKGALDSVIDLTDCAVTTKGGYIPPGRNAMPGERKLHLLVEGNSEVDVQRCKAEIIRMLEEAAADSRPEQTVKYAKYSIV